MPPIDRFHKISIRQSRWKLGYSPAVLALTATLSVAAPPPRPDANPADGEILVKGYLLRAHERWSKGDRDRARDDLLALLRLSPHDLSAFSLLAEFARQRGDTEAALGYYHQVLQIDPNSDTALSGIWQLFQSSKDSKGVIAEFEDLRRQYPQNALLIYYSGQAAMAAEDRTTAERYFIDFLNAQPDNIQGHNWLRQLLSDSHKTARLYEIYQDLVAAHPQSSAVHVGLAFSCQEQTPPDLGCAIAHHRQAADLAPQVARYHINLADALIAEEHYPEAIASYTQASQNSQDRNERIEIEFGLGKASLAVARLGLSADGQRSVPDTGGSARTDQVTAVAREQRLAGAIEHLREAERLNFLVNPEEQPAILYHLGQAYFELGDEQSLALAQGYFQRFSFRVGGAPAPALFSMYIQMGKAYLSMGAANLGLEAFHSAEQSATLRSGPADPNAAAAKPRSAIALYYTGHALHKAGSYAESRELLRKATLLVETVPQDQVDAMAQEDRAEFEAIRFEAPLLLGEVSALLNAPLEGKDALRRAERTAGTDPHKQSRISQARGRILLAQGQDGDAITSFQYANELDPGNHVVLAELAAAHAKASRFDDAHQILDTLDQLAERERPDLPKAELLRRQAQVDVDEARSRLPSGLRSARELLGAADEKLKRGSETTATLEVRKQSQAVASDVNRLEQEEQTRSSLFWLITALASSLTLLLISSIRWYLWPRLRNAGIRDDLTKFEEGLRAFIRREVLDKKRLQTQTDFIDFLERLPDRKGVKLASRIRSAGGADPLAHLGLGTLVGLLRVLNYEVQDVLTRRGAPKDLEARLNYIAACRNLIVHKKLESGDVELLQDYLKKVKPAFAPSDAAGIPAPPAVGV